jgi:predicted ATPase
MSTLVDTVNTVLYQGGQIIVAMESGVEIRFPVAGNYRLAKGTPQQLNHVEVSSYGLHWPDLDEDLSFRGLLEGDYGQDKACRSG